MGNRYAHLNEPDDTLDFHTHGRVSPGDVNRITIAFVKAAKARGCARVRIITGKGLRSDGAPKVRPQVERTLGRLEAQGIVQRFQTERRDRGGEGAFLAQLNV